MKLAIYTQIKENYGAHTWDGKGECPQYWKFKGGDTYVVENLSKDQARRIQENGIPHLKSLIESFSQAEEEYILDYSLLLNNEKPCNDWEAPIFLSWNGENWVAQRTIINSEGGLLRKEISSTTRTWTLLENGQRGDNEIVYTMNDGSVLDSAESITEWFEELDLA